MPTKIEWATETWNPVTGCTPISEGCRNCYAERMSKRLAGRCGYPSEDPFKVTLHPDKLDQPLRWKKPRMIFVCSMGDLFHKDVPFDQISQVFDVMCSWRWPTKEAECSGDASLLEDPGHTFMVLTKRPERIPEWLSWLGHYWTGDSPVNINLEAEGHFGKHIWFGVTAENQARADERIPILLQIPAAVRFVSIEPMLGPVDISKYLTRNAPKVYQILSRFYGPHGFDGTGSQPERSIIPGIDWVICGGETGPGARPMHPDWVRGLRNQCQAAGVPFFFKSWGDWYPDGKGLYHAPSAIFGDTVVHKLGKKAAGRLLDGQEWNQYPERSGKC
jgi:protein gp37